MLLVECIDPGRVRVENGVVIVDGSHTPSNGQTEVLHVSYQYLVRPVIANTAKEPRADSAVPSVPHHHIPLGASILPSAGYRDHKAVVG